MSTSIPLRCACGKVRGQALHASARTGSRIVCYCADCQAFARFLERTDVMNDAGGSDIFQMPPAHVRITEGADLLRCMRLSETGMIRWYTDCCRTPVGNTMSGRVPFIGLVQPFMDHASDGRSRDEALGEPLAGIYGDHAIGGCPKGVHPKGAVALIPRIARMLFGWWVKGMGTPSPFFDAKTKEPRVTPLVLNDAQRRAVRAPAAVASADPR